MAKNGYTIKKYLIHVLAALLLSFLLYKFASFTLSAAICIGVGAGLLGILYSKKKKNKI